MKNFSGLKTSVSLHSLAIWLSLMTLVVLLSSTNAQFFAKTSKNLPRIGRRGNQDQEMTEVIPSSVKALLAFVRKFDEDASGCLSPEELAAIPVFRLAIDYEDFTPLEIASDVLGEYKTEEDIKLKEVIERLLSAAYTQQ